MKKIEVACFKIARRQTNVAGFAIQNYLSIKKIELKCNRRGWVTQLLTFQIYANLIIFLILPKYFLKI